MADDRKGFYEYLLSLGIDKDDATAGADRYKKSIDELSSKASRASRSTSGSSGTGSVVSALGAAFIDQQVNTLGRISTSTGKLILENISKSASLNPLTIIKGVLDSALQGGEALIADLAELDKELVERVRGAGGYVGLAATDMMRSVRVAMIAAQEAGASTDETLDAVKSLMENSERMSIYSEKTISDGMIASLAFTKNSKTILENAENFRNVGLGLDDASKSITDIGLNSVKLGLNAKATSETLIKNLGMLNQYGFQNGIKGLSRMVQEAQALKINIDETFKIAEKLYDPESAINLAANLQVVGGAFGDLGDPIKLMYDATNNVESLQTSIIGAARSLATYNAEQGRFEVTGVNLRRAKAMSDALGMSMGELTNMAVKGAAKFEAMSQLDMFPSLDEEQKEFVSNLATMKDGKVGFDIPKSMVERLGLDNVKDGFVGLSDLSDKQIVQLQAMQKSAADEEPIDIARNQFNETTKILNVATAIYLRMMDDGRKTPLGKAASDGMEAAAKFMQKFNPAEDNTPETFKKFVNEAGNLGTSTTTEIVDMFKNFSPQMKEIMGDMQKKLSESTNNLNIQDIKRDTEALFEDLKKRVEPIIEKGKEALRDLNVMVKVDINSNSPLLANILVDEITKNPQTKANFVSILTKDNRAYS
jgi:hypothetical protein